MKYLLLLILGIIFCSIKSNNMIHPSVHEFYNQVNSMDHEVFLELQNDYIYFHLIKYEELDIDKIHQTRIPFGSKIDDYKNVNSLSKHIHYGYEYWEQADFSRVGFDKESGFVIFHTFLAGYGQSVDLATDKSGRIFKIKYYPGRVKFAKIWLIADSIKEIIKDDISTLNLNNDIGGILFSHLIAVKDVLGHNIEYKYPIDDLFSKHDYEIFFGQANNNTRINDKLSIVEWFDDEDLEGRYFNVVFKIAEQEFNVIYRKEKGEYIASLVDKMNSKLESMGSGQRLALVHENKWDSLHGLIIVSRGEFEKLDRHLLNIHG